MWSFALWDGNERKLFLSRDRFGEKPLYFYFDSDGFYFGSEIKFINSLINYNLKVNYNLLKRFLVYGYKYIYNTSDTYFINVNELSFASNIIINTDLIYKESVYW